MEAQQKGTDAQQPLVSWKQPLVWRRQGRDRPAADASTRASEQCMAECSAWMSSSAYQSSSPKNEEV